MKGKVCDVMTLNFHFQSRHLLSTHLWKQHFDKFSNVPVADIFAAENPRGYSRDVYYLFVCFIGSIPPCIRVAGDEGDSDGLSRKEGECDVGMRRLRVDWYIREMQRGGLVEMTGELGHKSSWNIIQIV